MKIGTVSLEENGNVFLESITMAFGGIKHRKIAGGPGNNVAVTMRVPNIHRNVFPFAVRGTAENISTSISDLGRA
jgi:hypothetical protein